VVADSIECCVIFFTGFIFGHAYLASLSTRPFAHYKAMITGYEEDEGEPKVKQRSG